MPYTIIAPPRISLDVFHDVLERAGSTAAPEATLLYEVCVQAGVDPAVALAFFAHENVYGTRGITAKHRTYNWGNMRRPFEQGRCKAIISTSAGPFASYSTWQDGLADWCDLIRYTYVDRWGLSRTDQALVRYAPAGQGDAPVAYSDHVDALIAQWMSRSGANSSLPQGTCPVDPRFDEAWSRSGGVWKPRQLTPGYAISDAVDYRGSPHQAFQRGVCRLELGGQTSWLTTAECSDFHRSLSS